MTQAAADGRRDVLTFRLDEEAYGINIMSVREIRGWTQTTALPHTPEHVLGVINLRGTVLPVLDLKCRLGFGRAALSERSVILVTHMGDRLAGLLVDAVSDIVSLSDDALQSPPTLLHDGQDTLLTGLALVDDRMIRVLDVPKVLETAEELAA